MTRLRTPTSEGAGSLDASRPRPGTFAALGAAVLLATAAVALTGSTAGATGFGFADLTPQQRRIVSGTLAAELDTAALAQRAAAPIAPRPAKLTAAACAARIGTDVKVNQNCLNLSDADLAGRGQAQNETWIAVNPRNPKQLVAGYNDYRRGDGTCGVSYSLDAGRSWADSTVPNGFVRGATFGGAPREYWQAGGDPSVAWDSRGNAYLSCLQFNRGSAASPDPDQSNGLYVLRSTGTAGASWNFPARRVAEHSDLAGTGDVFLDKQLMTVDSSVRSPFRDRVYVTWTTFAADGTAYIFAAHSADYGQTFSAPVLVSTDSPLCDNTFGLPTPFGKCNINQYSQPFTAPDGTLYVVHQNFNNAVSGTENRNQVLLSRSTDGGVTFSPPVRVAHFYDLPDCATFQNGANPGRSCVPEKGPSFNSIFRAVNYPVGAVDPTSGRVVVVFGSYISRNSNEAQGCAPAGLAGSGNPIYTGVKNGTCNNDVVLSVSTDRGASFTGTTTDPRQLPVVTTGARQARSDQYWQAVAFTPNGRLVVSYYDRQYGPAGNLGFSDISLSHARTLSRFTHRRVTSSSMPPATQFSGLFFGDYSGIAVTNKTAYPFWTDSRPAELFLCPGTGTATTPPAVCLGGAPNASVANDQDVFVKGVPLA